MKKICFTKDRPSLKPEQANREAFVHYNLAKIDNVEGSDDVEYF